VLVLVEEVRELHDSLLVQVLGPVHWLEVELGLGLEEGLERVVALGDNALMVVRRMGYVLVLVFAGSVARIGGRIGGLGELGLVRVVLEGNLHLMLMESGRCCIVVAPEGVQDARIGMGGSLQLLLVFGGKD